MVRILPFYIFIFFSFFALSQNNSFCTELKDIKRIIASSHYQPKTINDSLSKGVFGLFIKQLDENRRFFLQKDIDILRNDEFYLDDYLNKDDCGFINIYAELLAKRISEAKVILASNRLKSLDYSGVDSLYYTKDEVVKYFKGAAAANRYWNKRIRYKVLQKFVDNDSGLVSIKRKFKKLEPELKGKVIDNEICLLNELEQSRGNIKRLVEVAFLDSFLKYQDPNSTYLSTSDKTLFEKSVANSQLTFGVQTQKRKNGDIVIANIAPGSSAFKQGELDEEDVIISLSNSSETLDTYCTSNETITSFINDARTDIITFKVKKKNGLIKSIKLRKSNLEIADNSITGFLLKGDSTFGYIKIPSFYTDLESYHGFGVSNDVAKQIYKLQQENIDGLILDLRFNGGGSMKEAIELSGMFIDRGPVAISTVRGEESYTIRDPNRGSIFNKPMVVLVDQFSASASEFFAAAMQDYNRAIIVGSITHGKATSQFITPINNRKDANFIKLTTGQFFRVTGHSHQQIGVVPDISLPNIYDNYKTRESSKSFGLKNTSIEVKLPHRPKPPLGVDKIIELSAKRVNISKAFRSIKNFNKIFIEDFVHREGKYPLSLEFIYEDDKTYNDAWKEYATAIENNEMNFQVLNTNSTNTILSYNTSDKELNKNLRKDLAQDPYIQEAFYIIEDLLQL